MQNSDADVSKLMLIAVTADAFSEILWIVLGNLIEVLKGKNIKKEKHKLKKLNESEKVKERSKREKGRKERTKTKKKWKKKFKKNDLKEEKITKEGL